MDCSLAGSSVHGIFQARVLEWGAIAFSECGLDLGLKKSLLRFLNVTWTYRKLNLIQQVNFFFFFLMRQMRYRTVKGLAYRYSAKS